jgi:hypothetical protein
MCVCKVSGGPPIDPCEPRFCRWSSWTKCTCTTANSNRNHICYNNNNVRNNRLLPCPRRRRRMLAQRRPCSAPQWSSWSGVSCYIAPREECGTQSCKKHRKCQTMSQTSYYVLTSNVWSGWSCASCSCVGNTGNGNRNCHQTCGNLSQRIVRNCSSECKPCVTSPWNEWGPCVSRRRSRYRYCSQSNRSPCTSNACRIQSLNCGVVYNPPIDPPCNRRPCPQIP